MTSIPSFLTKTDPIEEIKEEPVDVLPPSSSLQDDQEARQIDIIENLIADEEEESIIEVVVQPASNRKLSAQIESKGSSVVVGEKEQHETLS